MENININSFATELSKLIGQHIGLDNIHPSTKGRSYYIQAPKAGAPMLLHHYRGPFFIDIHPDDFEALASGNVSAHDYIASADWQVGYYWGGSSMKFAVIFRFFPAVAIAGLAVTCLSRGNVPIAL